MSAQQAHCRRGQQPEVRAHLQDFTTILPNSVFISTRRNLLKNSMMSTRMLCQGYNKRGNWVLASGSRGKVWGQVDTSFPNSELGEWLLGKLDWNPLQPSYTSGYTSFYPKTQFTQLSSCLGQALGVGVGLGWSRTEVNQTHTCPPGPAVYSWVIQ